MMNVKLKQKSRKYPDLTPGQPYSVIGIEADAFRILNDLGRPFLFPKSLFALLDKTEPGDWLTEFGEDGERYSYPVPLNTPGFFEDFFDNKRKAVTVFWRVVNGRLASRENVA